MGNLKYNLAEFEIDISQLLVDLQDTDFRRLLTPIVLRVVKVSALRINFFSHKIDILLPPGYILKSPPCKQDIFKHAVYRASKNVRYHAKNADFGDIISA